MTTVPFDALIFNSSLTIRATDEGDEAVDTLASSIKAHGVLVPLTVRAAGNHVEIVKGGRRWRAIKRLDAGEARRTRKPKDKSPKPAPVETADTANAA